MSHQVRLFSRGFIWMLPVWAALLLYATLTEQPDPQTVFADFAAYVTTSQFLLTHIVGSIVGAAIGSIGLIGLMLFLQDTKVAGRAIFGMAATIAGNILMSSTYGVAAFAQPAMGRMFKAGHQNALEFYNQTYAAPLVGTALTGLLLFIVGGVFTGMALLASGRFTRWAGWGYLMATTCFALGLFFPPILQTISSALLLLITFIIAVRANRAYARQGVPLGISHDAGNAS